MDNKIEVKKAAMWLKKTKNGHDYYSVKVETKDGGSFWVNLFYNKYKKEEKHPMYITIDDTEKKKEDSEEKLPF